MMSGTAVLLIVNLLHLYMNMQYSQERIQLTIINTNTQIHDPDLDDEEQTHEQQSTDDNFNIEGNKAVVIENNKNDDEESDNELPRRASNT